MIIEKDGIRFSADPVGNSYYNGELLSQHGVLEPGFSVVWTDRPIYETHVVDDKEGNGSKVLKLVEPVLDDDGEVVPYDEPVDVLED